MHTAGAGLIPCKSEKFLRRYMAGDSLFYLELRLQEQLQLNYELRAFLAGAYRELCALHAQRHNDNMQADDGLEEELPACLRPAAAHSHALPPTTNYSYAPQPMTAIAPGSPAAAHVAWQVHERSTPQVSTGYSCVTDHSTYIDDAVCSKRLQS